MFSVCSPTGLNITVELDPIKEHQDYPINLTCSNWKTESLNFRIWSPTGSNETQYFELIPTTHPQKYELHVNSTSTPIKTFYEYITISSEVDVLNTISFNISVNRKKTIELTLLYKHTISEMSPPGQIITEFEVNSSYPANLIVQSDDLPESFVLSKIRNNTFRIETLEILDLDILRKGNNCCSSLRVSSEETRCNNIECLYDGVKYIFNVNVSDPKHNVTNSFPLSAHVIDFDDHDLVCKNLTILSRRSLGSIYGICTDEDYYERTLRYYTSTSTCEEELKIHENGTVELVGGVKQAQTSCHYRLIVSDEAHKITTNLTIKFNDCPPGTDDKHQEWEIGDPGTESYKSCPDGYAGTVRRYCTMEGYYEDPIYNCTSVHIMKIMEDLKSSHTDADEALDKLSNFTSTDDKNNGTLQYGDIASVVNILSEITDNLDQSSTSLPEITDKYLQVVDNIIDEKFVSSWNDTKQKTQVNAETVMETLDKFTERVASGNLTTDIEVPKSNLYLKIARVTSCDNNVEFPDRKSPEKVAEWTKNSMDLVRLPCSKRTVSSAYSGVVYRDPSKLFNKHSYNDSTISMINAPILSFSLFPISNETLDEPVELIFDIHNKSLRSPNCSYWSTTDRIWATDGCWLVSYNKEDNTVTCHCNHLTNFAILMSPSDTKEGEHYEALSTITLVGCIISMICLGVTIFMLGLFWQYVRSPRTIIHLNLSISLFIAFLIFVTVLEATKNKEVCMAIAALLHFFLLVAFFTMLVEGLNLAFIVLKPLRDKKPAIPLLIGAYILAFIVTGVSLGAQFSDYIREDFCWLSGDSGAIWSFIGPVLLVVASNIIIVIIVMCKMFGTASISKKTNKEKTKIAVRNIIILTPTLGLSWIIGVFAVNENTIVFQYLFAILNSLQGLLIFIVHLVLNNKIRDAIRNRYSRWISARSFSVEKANKNMKLTTISSSTSTT
ncbi:hypothetical protein ACF0H5_008539 [Mactra antiquata]